MRTTTLRDTHQDRNRHGGRTVENKGESFSTNNTVVFEGQVKNQGVRGQSSKSEDPLLKTRLSRRHGRMLLETPMVPILRDED